MRRIPLLFLVVAACSSAPVERWTPAAAPEPLPWTEIADEGAGGGSAEHGGEGAKHEESEYKNLVGLFGGYTWERAGGGVTVGLEYERRINSWLGVGGFGEVVGGSHVATVVGAGMYLRPVEKAAIVLMPGVEWVKGDSADGLLRTGVIYDLWQDGRKIAVPGLYVDFFRGKIAVALGVSLAWEF